MPTDNWLLSLSLDPVILPGTADVRDSLQIFLRCQSGVSILF